jgi:hypothetical protein
MARLKNVVHSEDACTMIFEGNPKSPEPSTGVIKFPGGHIEVARCSDNSYYCHIERAEEGTEIIASRIDYMYEQNHNGILDIPDAEHIRHIAFRIKQLRLD